MTKKILLNLYTATSICGYWQSYSQNQIKKEATEDNFYCAKHFCSKVVSTAMVLKGLMDVLAELSPYILRINLISLPRYDYQTCISLILKLWKSASNATFVSNPFWIFISVRLMLLTSQCIAMSELLWSHIQNSHLILALISLPRYECQTFAIFPNACNGSSPFWILISSSAQIQLRIPSLMTIEKLVANFGNLALN